MNIFGNRIDEYQQKQKENLERYRIMFGEERARKMEEQLADPNVSVSVHISPPYDTMPLDKLRRVVAFQKLSEQELCEKASQEIKQGEYEHVEEICTVILNRNENSIDGWKYLGDAMSAQGRHKDAQYCQERLRALK